MECQCFFYSQRIIRINFDFHVIMRKIIIKWLIPNHIEIGIIFFRAKYNQISSSIINFNKSFHIIKFKTQMFWTNQIVIWNFINQYIFVWFFNYWNIINIRILKFSFVKEIITRIVFNADFFKFIILYSFYC